MMMFLSKWLRRSNANTGAEWLQTRFGLEGRGVRASHIVVIAFALLSCFGFLAYGFIGLGKFMEIFIPWDLVKGYVPFDVAPKYVPHVYGITFTLFASSAMPVQSRSSVQPKNGLSHPPGTCRV